MSDDFKPYAVEPVPDGYRQDELTNVYADAWEQGLWVREYDVPDGYLAAVGSSYLLQKFEHEDPSLGVIDPSDLTLEDLMMVSAPGAGDTRLDAVRSAIAMFHKLDLADEHKVWHEEVTNG